MKDPDQAWRKLVEAARRVPAAPPAPPAPPPEGLAGRVVALRRSIVALARVLFWRRWTRIVALACGALLLSLFAIHRCTEAKPPLIDAPDPLQPVP